MQIEIVNTTEKKIITGKTPPKVSVCVTTYNQEKYIRKCLDSILSQKTSFNFEIIVHDDASQDATPAIIIEYQKKYPDLIVLILQKENCYRSSKNLPLLNCAQAARSDFIALCEGDDYWINNQKLEKQYGMMEMNANTTLVISPGRMEYNGRVLSKIHCWHGKKARLFHAQDVLDAVNQFAPTASYFLRKDILIQSLKTFSIAPIGDLFVEVFAGIHGDIVYFPEIFSMYRLQADASWSKRINQNKTINIKNYLLEMQKTIAIFDSDPSNPKLDWSKKIAATYYGLAIASIEEGAFQDFKDAITKSMRLNNFSRKQFVLYTFRNSKTFIRFFKALLPLLKRVKF